MNWISFVSRLSISAIAGFIIALFVTVVVWNLRIEHRAFHCTDDVGFGFFWENLNTHQQAGDSIAAGWTWSQIRKASAIYDIAFFFLWFAVSTLAGVKALSRSDKHILAALD